MAVSGRWYGLGAKNVAEGGVLWKTSGGSTIKCALFTDSYTPNLDTDSLYSELTGEVANGNGYTTGGATLTTTASTYTGATNTVAMDADDVTWSSSTITARYAVIYVSTSSQLLGYIDFGTNMSSSNGDFKITWASTGVLKMVVSEA